SAAAISAVHGVLSRHEMAGTGRSLSLTVTAGASISLVERRCERTITLVRSAPSSAAAGAGTTAPRRSDGPIVGRAGGVVSAGFIARHPAARDAGDQASLAVADRCSISPDSGDCCRRDGQVDPLLVLLV